jgi:putative ABC transport system substrate-binding protein
MLGRTNRRAFIAGLGGAAAWPMVLRAEPSPVVGYLHALSRDISAEVIKAFQSGLSESGYVEGKNIVIEYRFADGRFDRLPQLASDLVGKHVSLIATSGGSASAIAAKAATSTTPIVCMMGDVDPVQAGLVASLSRPGGNLTGISLLGGALGKKRLEILRELLPNLETLAILVNPANRNAEIDSTEVDQAAHEVGVRTVIVRTSTPKSFEQDFDTLARQNAGAVLVTADGMFTNARVQLTEIAARYRIPTIYQWREFAVVGGLISYGTSLTDASRQVGVYSARILKGEKPADLPVQQPTKFEFVINLKAAKALGLEIPGMLLARADEVIE